MNEDIRLGRIAGFPVAINWSVLVIVWLLTWSLADGSLPHAAPGHSPGTYWIAGLAGALLFFGSLLAHELAHAVVARRAGVEVKGLTLWLFGGVATLGGEASTPRHDFRIAAVGPATSLGLAAGFGVVAASLNGLGAAHLVVAVAGWLAGINLLLGVFNLVPGAPLDGGRILRAFLWRRRGDRTRAAISAAHAGRVVGYGLIGLGLLEFLIGASLGGLWLVFIGWFILSAARAEEAHIVARHVLAGVRVGDVMSRSPQVAPGWITVDEFVDRYLLGNRHSAYPVEGLDGRIHGLLTLAQLRVVQPHEPSFRAGGRRRHAAQRGSLGDARRDARRAAREALARRWRSGTRLPRRRAGRHRHALRCRPRHRGAHPRWRPLFVPCSSRMRRSTVQALEITVALPLDQAESAVRDALAEQGFGVLTEIDVAATLKSKLNVERPPLKILGACNPHLAHQALQLDPSASLVLPCNVVIEPAQTGTPGSPSSIRVS